jgi:hypothetical protein
MQATVRFHEQLVDDRVEVFDACPEHADYVRTELARRRAKQPDTVLDVRQGTPPEGTACPYDGAHPQGLIPSEVEDGQLMSTT